MLPQFIDEAVPFSLFIFSQLFDDLVKPYIKSAAFVDVVEEFSYIWYVRDSGWSHMLMGQSTH